MKVPTHVMYYEDYTTRYDGVIKELNDFLELPRVNPPIPFVEGKTYLKFFTRTEIEAARTMFRFFATEQCWALVRHYFDIDDNAETHDESVVNGPDVVWLVSFPNSVRVGFELVFSYPLLASLTFFFSTGNLLHHDECHASNKPHCWYQHGS